MLDELSYIKIGSKEYPILCNMIVLEGLQNKYGTLTDYEYALRGVSEVLDDDGIPVNDENGNVVLNYGTPSLEAIIDGVYPSICEGINYYNEINGESMDIPTELQIKRCIVSIMDMSLKFFKEFIKCFEVKNASTTQD